MNLPGIFQQLVHPVYFDRPCLTFSERHWPLRTHRHMFGACGWVVMGRVLFPQAETVWTHVDLLPWDVPPPSPGA